MNDTHAFHAAKKFVIPFGKYRGKTLNEVAETDEGLTYLDWMRGLGDLYEDTRRALDNFLNHEPVARDLQAALDAKEQPRR